MTTGKHEVVDAKCGTCNTILGWYYIKADEEEQRYKEGKWCIERALVVDQHQTIDLDVDVRSSTEITRNGTSGVYDAGGVQG